MLSLIYSSLFLSGICYCVHVFWCASARMWELELWANKQTLNFLLNLERVETKWKRCYCKFTDIILWRKQKFTIGWNFFWGKRKCHWRRGIRTASNKQKWRKHCKSSSNCAWKSSADCQEHSRSSDPEHSRVNEHRQRNRKILTEDFNMRSVCAKMVPN